MGPTLTRFQTEVARWGFPADVCTTSELASGVGERGTRGGGGPAAAAAVVVG